jgi:queuine tRNA-ribosyltransferase
MGLGTPPQLLEMIARGMDMFDCVLPTRLARNGTAFTASGTINLKNAEFALDKSPIEENCACPTCREFARGYVRHLVKAEEILGLRLITLHNSRSDKASTRRNRKRNVQRISKAFCFKL